VEVIIAQFEIPSYNVPGETQEDLHNSVKTVKILMYDQKFTAGVLTTQL
jgi:hypothetical protein